MLMVKSRANLTATENRARESMLNSDYDVIHTRDGAAGAAAQGGFSVRSILAAPRFREPHSRSTTTQYQRGSAAGGKASA
jgi:hypothetical protein